MRVCMSAWMSACACACVARTQGALCARIPSVPSAHAPARAPVPSHPIVAPRAANGRPLMLPPRVRRAQIHADPKPPKRGTPQSARDGGDGDTADRPAGATVILIVSALILIISTLILIISTRMYGGQTRRSVRNPDGRLAHSAHLVVDAVHVAGGRRSGAERYPTRRGIPQWNGIPHGTVSHTTRYPMAARYPARRGARKVRRRLLHTSPRHARLHARGP